MKRILAPRGGGRTYAICEYAVKNNCNILVPMRRTASLCALDYIRKIAANLGIVYLGYGGTGYSCCSRVRLESEERGEYEIRIFIASKMTDVVRGLQIGDKPIVIDDIDHCFSLMYPVFNIAACSLMTYDPSDVALTPPATSQEAPLQDECVCDSLV